ncbi:pentapeptide repeat-containing protein [Nostocaceae cyanobacterium CENA357]|uniref:Pentapeptide repeat-containing protein n=1 Tax=Atlanticothrix silvestris CENA357 TaxID=1725252 RepID=A0A8J7HJQ0_9CYAN|nr:pentapeptide repeat-containing protein [Atlanticothrix silvestris]MBH8553788.1 pentapeptide repeat-containing protein [Atlanticothrix silvestris CENA357]
MLKVMIHAYYSAKRHSIINQLPFINIIPQIVFNQDKTRNLSHRALQQCLRLAIEHLNHPTIENRLVAIYDLEKFAHDYPQHHWKIIAILTNFVRNNAPVVIPEESTSQPSLTICTDIQLALTVIGRREVQKELENEQIDLSHTDLRGVNLNQANLELTNFYQVNLSGANLSGANLSGAILSAANLSEANLSGANLSGAILSAANLSGANLSGANLSKSNLYLANLCEAIIYETKLDGANLREAQFSITDTVSPELGYV